MSVGSKVYTLEHRHCWELIDSKDLQPGMNREMVFSIHFTSDEVDLEILDVECIQIIDREGSEVIESRKLLRDLDKPLARRYGAAFRNAMEESSVLMEEIEEACAAEKASADDDGPDRFDMDDPRDYGGEG